MNKAAIAKHILDAEVDVKSLELEWQALEPAFDEALIDPLCIEVINRRISSIMPALETAYVMLTHLDEDE